MFIGHSGLPFLTVRERSINLAVLELQSVDAEPLESSFTEDDIWNVIHALPPDKAPGPDGFSARFYQSPWPTIKEVVMRAVRAFDVGDRRGFVKLNEVYITLLPKCDGTVDVKDHWPVSLVHSSAKILAKAMSLHLAPALPHLIAPNQSAFIGGHAIMDNFMLVQQLIRSLHR